MFTFLKVEASLASSKILERIWQSLDAGSATVANERRANASGWFRVGELSPQTRTRFTDMGVQETIMRDGKCTVLVKPVSNARDERELGDILNDQIFTVQDMHMLRSIKMRLALVCRLIKHLTNRYVTLRTTRFHHIFDSLHHVPPLGLSNLLR